MPEIKSEDRGVIRVLTIDKEQQMNVLSRALVAELAQHARQAAVAPSLRGVVITGSGHRAFSPGPI